MESSVALGQLEVTPGPGSAAGVRPSPRAPGSLQGSLQARDRSEQRAQEQAYLDGCVPLSHQVAGHKYGVDKVGILQHPDGTVLKQVQPPPRGPREMQFYSMVYAEDCCDPCLVDLQKHLPKYYGTWSSPDIPNDVYLKLEDVTRRFSRPCIMDVKLGQQSYDPFASQEKREQQIRKYPLMEEIGFLILGMRVFNLCSETFDSYDQHYGRGLVQSTVKEGLAKFFHNGRGLRQDAIAASIRRVQQILHWFESQQQLAFYASSLLFVYEGLPPPSAPAPLGGREGGVLQDLGENNNNTELAASCGCSQMCSRGLYICPEGGGPHPPTGPDSGDHTSALRDPPWGLEPAPQRNRNQPPLGEGGGEPKAPGGAGPAGRGGEADVEVRMIDFAHVFPSQSPDRGYIYGLKHLLTVLEQILCDAAQGAQLPAS